MQRIDCLARLSELLFLSRTLTSRYCLREEKASAPVAAGGAGGLPRLRWPSGLCEVVETAVLPPVGSGRPSNVRVRFPAAAAASWNKVLPRSPPRLVGSPLRRRRRARGGCAPGMELLYRSRSPAVHRPRGMVSSSASRIQDKKAASGRADGWRVDRARVSRGGFRHRRRVPVQGWRGLGCILGRCGINVCFFYCGYFQSLMAIGLLRPWVGGGASPAMAGDSDDVRLRPAEDLESYVHFLCSLGASVQNDRYSCLRYLSRMYLYVYVSFVRFP